MAPPARGDRGRARRARAVGVAAALLVLVLLGLLAGACADDDDGHLAEPISPTTAAPDPTAAPPATPPASGGATEGDGVAPLAPTTVVDDGCDLPVPATWDVVGSMHTVVESPDPVTAEVGALEGRVCPGGRLRVSVRLTNGGTAAVTVAAPRLLLGAGPPKWVLATMADVTLEPGASADVAVEATLPAVTPGDGYWLGVYGYGPGGELSIAAPG